MKRTILIFVLSFCTQFALAGNNTNAANNALAGNNTNDVNNALAGNNTNAANNALAGNNTNAANNALSGNNTNDVNNALSGNNANIFTAPESPYGFQPLEMYEFPQKDFPITKFGARKNDARATMKAFEKAMTACNKAGGGRVVVPAGEWLSGAIHFKSNCNLYLEEGAKLVFEDKPELYLPAVQSSWEGVECMNYSPLLYAFECKNVAISGQGTLESKMDLWKTWFPRTDAHLQATRQLYAMGSTDVPVQHRHMEEGEAHMRPQLIHFNRCTNVRFDGFKIRNSPFWTIHLLLCKDVLVKGVDSFAHGQNNDGVDIEMTSHVLVEDCTFDQGDDGIVLKAGRNRDAWRLATPTQDVVVRNCRFVESHGLLVVGSEMSGGVRNVYMHDCSVSSLMYNLFYIKTNIRRGGIIENIMMENCSGIKMNRAFAIDTDVLYQWRTIVPTFEEKPTVIRNIVMKNVSVDEVDSLMEILGDEREPVRNVTIEGLHAKKINKYTSKFINVYDLQLVDISVKE